MCLPSACTISDKVIYLPRKSRYVKNRNRLTFLSVLFFPISEKLAEAPTKIVKPPVPSNANKWDGEDEDDVKVCIPWTNFATLLLWLLANVRLCSIGFRMKMKSTFVSLGKWFRYDNGHLEYKCTRSHSNFRWPRNPDFNCQTAVVVIISACNESFFYLNSRTAGKTMRKKKRRTAKRKKMPKRLKQKSNRKSHCEKKLPKKRYEYTESITNYNICICSWVVNSNSNKTFYRRYSD